MKQFVKQILLFLLPIGILSLGVIPFYFAAVRTGEFGQIEDHLQWQRDHEEVLLGLGYNEQIAYSQKLNATYYKAPVITLGTSRVMQFKEFYFSAPFYNTGGLAGGNFDEYVNALENLGYVPDTILLGLDAWVFNDAWNWECAVYEEYEEIGEYRRGNLVVMSEMMSDWIDGKWTFDSLEDYPSNVGFNGRIKGDGFMKDGSYYYGSRYRNPQEQVDYEFRDTLHRIETGTNRFEWGDEVDEDTWVQLCHLLDYCAENGIHVVAFLAPFAPTVYDAMVESGNYGYLEGIAPLCQNLFDQYGYEFYDFLDGHTLPTSDEGYVDGFHGSEVTYAYIIEKMLREESTIGAYIDKEKLYDLLNHSYDEKTFFSPFSENGENVNSPMKNKM